MHPARTAQEEHARQSSRVDHRRSEVRLHEDEEDRGRRQADCGEHRPAIADPLRTVSQQTGEEEDEEHLAELGGLELEETEVEPALRAARDGSGEQNERHQSEHHGVDLLSITAVVLGVDEDGHDEHEHPERGIDALPDDVVVRVSCHVVPRDAGDRPEPVGNEPARCGEQDPVEAPNEGGGLDGLAAPAAEAARPGVDGLNHSSPEPQPGPDGP